MGLLESFAEQLLAAACSGQASGEWTVVLQRDGGLGLLAGGQTPLDSVLLTRGAMAVWRVRRRGAQVLVEGFDGRERCGRQARIPSEAARMLNGSLARSCLLLSLGPGVQAPISRRNPAASSGGVGLM